MQTARVAWPFSAVDRVLIPGPSFHGGGNLVVAARSVWVFDDLQSSLMRLPIAAFRS